MYPVGGTYVCKEDAMTRYPSYRIALGLFPLRSVRLCELINSEVGCLTMTAFGTWNAVRTGDGLWDYK